MAQVGDGAGLRPAVFVDRDGTIIREREYLADPAGVELLPGAAEGLAALTSAGFAVVIITNQSGIARGYFDEEAYRAVQDRVETELARRGAPVLASYHCPHHPAYTGPCDCRKPGNALFRLAAREHGLDLGASAFVGDRLRDVQPARSVGGVAVLVRTGYGGQEAGEAPEWVTVVADLAEAAGTIIATLADVDGDAPSG
jgi:D-glycero-D-manno-heptose 1,7-bisphosphate phosphatase